MAESIPTSLSNSDSLVTELDLMRRVQEVGGYRVVYDRSAAPHEYTVVAGDELAVSGLTLEGLKEWVEEKERTHYSNDPYHNLIEAIEKCQYLAEALQNEFDSVDQRIQITMASVIESEARKASDLASVLEYGRDLRVISTDTGAES